jgi:three-Cys-motif partner protein
MTTNTKLWTLEPHTVGKHRVLREYLNAWFPIMGTWNGRILFIDGFSGPGEYDKGEEGSPVIALRAYAEHVARKAITAEVGFFFVEEDARRAEHLKGLIEQHKSDLPPNCATEVLCGRFDETLAGPVPGR